MIDRNHDLSITRQAELLGMSRGMVYYLPRPISAADLALMRRIDALHLEHPFMGARGPASHRHAHAPHGH
jgi:putative transposase